ncbi:MAG: VWA domain-containing protein [Saprospiraceae bacterium]|nr:MAG: VWA domain-containing protein [Saprospiraceae bacterium]
MKAFSIPALLSLVFIFLAIAGCKKDNGTNPVDLSKYYRLKSFEVGVVPEQRTVQVLFQATDYSHNGVSTLTEDDFIVSENDGRIDTEADIRLGQGSIPYVLKNVLLLDISRSVEGLVPQIKAAAKALIQNKLDNQEIAIYTFAADITGVQSFTTDKAALLAAIDQLPESGLVNSTNLYGAIIEVADLWQDAFEIDGIVDGSLVIFTDGRHNASQVLTLNSAKNALGTRKVYVAALDSPDLDETALKSLAVKEERYFKANDVAGLEQMFLSIQQEIQGLANSIYFLYYQSPITDPAPYNNKLKIEVKENLNNGSDRQIVEMFNSAGFGN